jgi:drug/metabolite transporter (DMT)-like permease
MSRSSRFIDWLLLLGPGTIWGASFLFIAEGLTAVGPGGVTFLRILIGCSTLALFPSARRSVARADLGKIALLGVVWLAFPLTMFPFAEQRVSSALTGMLNGANPLFTAAVGAVMTQRMPSRGILTGLAVGLIGAVTIALPSIHEGTNSIAGIVMILAALLSYGIALNLAHALQERNGALAVILRAQVVALVLTAPLGIPDLFHAQWSIRPLLSLIALGAFGTGIAYALLGVAAGRLGATRASATTFLIPGIALVLGVVVRGESVALLSVAGSVMCVLGAWILRRERIAESHT